VALCKCKSSILATWKQWNLWKISWGNYQK
jgi:hypothetical protein